MTPPINILVIGATGVGKSSLINAVLGYEVAETGAITPVTRGINLYDGSIGGVSCRFYDSAGYDLLLDSSEYISQLSGIVSNQLVPGAMSEINIVWFLISAPSLRFMKRDAGIISALKEKSIPTVFILTKADVVTSEEIEAIKPYIASRIGISPSDLIETSAYLRSREPFGLKEIIDKTLDHYSNIFPGQSLESRNSIPDVELSKQLLEELEDWKLEAKLENTKRYFYHTKAVERISSGSRLYVIGRKGAGKTAICEHLNAFDKEGYFSEKLTFKNFPFNVLYDLSDSGYTQPNQYITIWKYLIYSVVCKMLSGNEKIDRRIRNRLKKAFSQDVGRALPKTISEWTSFEFNLSLLGAGITIGGDRKNSEDSSLNLSKNVDVLEQFISSTIDSSTYVILFDELDEDYRNLVEEEGYYIDLLTSLFKATQDIRARFSHSRILPIVFLRNDIYDVLQDSDKNKWSDYKIGLDWSEESLKKLLAFRISKSVSTDQDALPFWQAWRLAFTQETLVSAEFSSDEEVSIFSYIEKCTYDRPRDFIKYIQIASEISIERGYSKINAEVVKASEKKFSSYLKAEIEDEIYAVVPEIKQILNLLTKQRSQSIDISVFRDMYEAEIEKGAIPSRDYRYVLEVLFNFSVIGNISRRSRQNIFKYENEEAHLNLDEQICIHRGLLRSLQIF